MLITQDRVAYTLNMISCQVSLSSRLQFNEISISSNFLLLLFALKDEEKQQEILVCGWPLTKLKLNKK